LPVVSLNLLCWRLRVSCLIGRAAMTSGVSVNSTRRYGGPMASVKQFQVTFDCAEPE
jgi:hypothetical protein